MKKTKNNQHSDDDQPYNQIEYALFCDGLEKQYKKAKKDGVFEILKVLKLDKKNSEENLVQAVDYFNEKGGVVDKDAPTGFLTDHEKSMVTRDGEFRPELYCILLSTIFSNALQNKTAFIQHSFKYSFK